MTTVQTGGPPNRFVFFLVVTALLVRIAVIPFLIGTIVDPARDHWDFGCEEGRIARSIAAGEGFSSPLFGKTGPTSWSAPAYPYLLAGIFHVFGIYSRSSAWAILSLNALFSALTCIPVVYVMWPLFGKRAAQISGWAWAFFPYAIYFAAAHVWGYCLDALTLMTVLWATYAIEKQTRLVLWLLYGLLWGIASLVNPVILATLPALLGWLAWRRHKLAMPSRAALIITVAALCISVSPWFVRNYRTFGRFIPFRGIFWKEFWAGNTGDISDVYPDWTNPGLDATEMNKYSSRGELAYMAEKRTLGLDFIKHQPSLFLRLTARRIAFTWTGFWTLRSDYLAGEPFAFPNIAMCSLLTLFMCAGIRQSFRSGQLQVIPFLLILAFYPLVYYVTHIGMEYRHPLDPLVVMLGAVAVAGLFAARNYRSRVVTR